MSNFQKYLELEKENIQERAKFWTQNRSSRSSSRGRGRNTTTTTTIIINDNQGSNNSAPIRPVSSAVAFSLDLSEILSSGAEVKRNKAVKDNY